MMKKLIAGIFAFVLTIGGFSTLNVAYAADTKNCSDFDTQQEAQSFWDENGYTNDNDPHQLEGNDDDGLVCESLPDGTDSPADTEDTPENEESAEEAAPVSDKDCKHFATQQEAQNFWEKNGYSKDNDPHRLDRDKDGIPCEEDGSDVSEQSGEQGTSEEGTTQQDDTTAGTDSSDQEQGGELPNTSTSYATYTLFGLALVVLGGSLFAIRKRYQ
ncbi:excalibur calcium-binding domain-containing protein [Halobacillus shinanisalinarum]|uniref:Excalibur calcium-binding domain-containing protein n=1 Tax=Halobacillus shinanisalinarum TaxID=2932258 RepID=A0ABY4H399_9BACI|nr:excalibur calcium-binding domain-containing protein [Halobacillus shinanisalinarum]UOQ94671.1 excalibur calcium-binding domain-containing protein [Halobacillus shinanisalinarum]